ncbi:hypothetical protein [Candidatus Nanohalobium constans]|uniref:Uncharacterized protein n=1 Tax=Candidatus Nanohalobium constans TaxID=2565781 RepID=A0A5Q0UG02_9ARCH|nr:hypothetical protein [Candidatus Nanohalobium constans]QGA80572.1 hypothetical protein LC1Nh_0683 [Candidatus Nanohalobium constans]
MTNFRGSSEGGFLKKFFDKSVIFDLFVLGVLALDAYLLQQTGTFSSSGITQFPPQSIEILAAQLTALLIVMKVLNAYIDSE